MFHSRAAGDATCSLLCSLNGRIFIHACMWKLQAELRLWFQLHFANLYAFSGDGRCFHIFGRDVFTL